MSAKAVVLAAGRGTRLCPLTPFIPKEMLPVDGLPVIHHVLKELILAGITDVMIVLSEGKESIRNYLTASVLPKGNEANLLSAERESIRSSLNIAFVNQTELLGTAHAIGLASSYMGEDPMLVVFPDDILFDAKAKCVITEPTRQCIDLSVKTGDSVLLAAEIPGCEASQYGVLRISDTERGRFVSDIVEKPLSYREATAYVLIGRMMITPRVMQSIPEHHLNDGEGIIPALLQEAAIGRLRANVYAGERYDLGSHRGYRSLLKSVLYGEGRENVNGERTLPNMPS